MAGSGVTKAEKPLSKQDGGPALLGLGMRPRGDVAVGHTTSPRSASPPSWLVGAFPALVTPLPAMDCAHGLPLYGAPSLLLRRHVVTLPAKVLGEEVQDTYKRRRRATEQGVRSWISLVLVQVRFSWI